jgi:hypothetical protein
MKLLQTNQIRLRAAHSAFTLPEILISSTIFVALISIGMVTLQLFGIRSGQLSATKMVSTADSLRTIAQFRDQVRGAAAVQVGFFTSNTLAFTTNADGTGQIGNAVQVFPTVTTNANTVNLNAYSIFYLNTNSVNANLANLYIYSIDTNGNVFNELLASSVVNTNCFFAEDFNGNVLSNNQNNCAIHLMLQFYSNVYVFGNLRTNFYYLDTRATPRAPNLN